jgi:hypothetical protein
MKDDPKCFCYYENHEWYEIPIHGCAQNIKLKCDTCENIAKFATKTIKISCGLCIKRSSKTDWKKISKIIKNMRTIIDDYFTECTNKYNKGLKVLEFIRECSQFTESLKIEYKAIEKNLDIFAEKITIFQKHPQSNWSTYMKINYLRHISNISDLIIPFNRLYFVYLLTNNYLKIDTPYVVDDIDRENYKIVLTHYVLNTTSDINLRYLLLSNQTIAVEILIDLVCQHKNLNILNEIIQVISTFNNIHVQYFPIIMDKIMKYDYADALSIEYIGTYMMWDPNLLYNIINIDETINPNIYNKFIKLKK